MSKTITTAPTSTNSQINFVEILRHDFLLCRYSKVNMDEDEVVFDRAWSRSSGQQNDDDDDDDTEVSTETRQGCRLNKKHIKTLCLGATFFALVSHHMGYDMGYDRGL